VKAKREREREKKRERERERKKKGIAAENVRVAPLVNLLQCYELR